MEDNQITDDDKNEDKLERIELVQKAAEGDKEAFTQLYTLTYSEVYHIVKVFIYNEDTVQDIVQETYFKCLRKIRQLKDRGQHGEGTSAESRLGVIFRGRRGRRKKHC